MACDSITVRQKRQDAIAKMKTTIHTFGPALKSHTGKGSPQWLWGPIAKMPTIGEYDAPSFSRPMNDTATRTRPGNPHFFGLHATAQIRRHKGIHVKLKPMCLRTKRVSFKSSRTAVLLTHWQTPVLCCAMIQLVDGCRKPHVHCVADCPHCF